MIIKRFAVLFFISFLLLSFIPIKKLTDKPDLILFMLHKSTRKIEALKKQNNLKYVNLITKEDSLLNDAIMTDFKNNFKFCPVYFFYSESFDDVIQKNWEKVNFISNDKQKISFDLLRSKNVFIAEVNYPPISKYDTISSSRVVKVTGSSDDAYANRNDPYGILLYNDLFQLVNNQLEYTNANYGARKSGFLKKSKDLPKQFVGAEKFNLKLKKAYSEN